MSKVINSTVPWKELVSCFGLLEKGKRAISVFSSNGKVALMSLSINWMFEPKIDQLSELQYDIFNDVSFIGNIGCNPARYKTDICYL